MHHDEAKPSQNLAKTIGTGALPKMGDVTSYHMFLFKSPAPLRCLRRVPVLAYSTAQHLEETSTT
jgi:hypothetical protein